MSLTTDPNDPQLGKARSDGQNEKYLVLSEEERKKGFVRPVRRSYQHVGLKPKYPLRALTEEECYRFDPDAKNGYVKFEEYPKDSGPNGKFWTAKELRGGCGTVTTMGQALAETYARNPKFYGATFCCTCGVHLPVGEFVWGGTNEIVGS